MKVLSNMKGLCMPTEGIVARAWEEMGQTGDEGWVSV